MATDQIRHIVVIGAGVVGLTMAIAIQEKGGYQVTIIAESLPGDPRSTRYTSQWAGAQHVSAAGPDDSRQHTLDKKTFEIWSELAAPGGAAEHCFLHIPEKEYFIDAPPAAGAPHPLDFMPNFRYLEPHELVAGTTYGVAFDTLTADVPIYLAYLAARFASRGGRLVRGAVQHIAQVVEGGAGAFTGAKNGPAPDAVVVCAGLGARTLGGVEDKDVFPIRGQTVLVRAPWVRFGFGVHDLAALAYIVPRRSGEIIVGGTVGVDDWYPVARPETAREILERVLAIYPELAPPEVRAIRAPTIDDLDIIEHGCGLRPGRKGGIRLEVEWLERPASQAKVPIVYNYGHAGMGFQSSWGSALEALKLLEHGLQEHVVQ